MLTEFSGLKYYRFFPRLPLPGPLFVTWLGPKPLGITPPSYFGLPERYFLGMTPSEVEDLLSGEAAKQGAENKKVLIAAQQAAAALGVLRDQVGTASDADLAAAEKLYDRLFELKLSNPYFGGRIDLPIGLFTAIDTERFKRLRAVTAGTLAVLTLVALQAQNPPDP